MEPPSPPILLHGPELCKIFILVAEQYPILIVLPSGVLEGICGYTAYTLLPVN